MPSGEVMQDVDPSAAPELDTATNSANVSAHTTLRQLFAADADAEVHVMPPSSEDMTRFAPACETATSRPFAPSVGANANPHQVLDSAAVCLVHVSMSGVV
jgi:hypothetical protein